MDLLEMLAAQDGAETTPGDVVHALMPNMAMACGLGVIELLHMREASGEPFAYVLGTRGQRLPTDGADREVAADCPDCIAAAEPHGGLAAWCTAMQRNQAPVKG